MPFEERAAAAWAESCRQKLRKLYDLKTPEEDFRRDVRLWITSLSDGDFDSYFLRITKNGETFAESQVPYEQVIMSFHLYEDAVSPYLQQLYPDNLLGALNVLDHLYHNVIAILARSYFEKLERKRIESDKSSQAEIVRLAEQRQLALNAVRESERRLAERNAELEFLNKELEAYNYSISHDLRAPLRSIFGFSKIVYQEYADRLDTQGKDFLIRIKNASERMGQLIEDLLRLSHISRQELNRMDYDLSSLASTVISGLHESDPSREVETVITDSLRAFIDPHLMKVALTNLLENSLKFTSKTRNARIEFGAQEIGSKTAYFVRDNGAGFDPAYAGKMFQPFQRLHSEKEFEGTGIGLAIVERIIHRHEGIVWAEGVVGKGTTVYFTLAEN